MEVSGALRAARADVSRMIDHLRELKFEDPAEQQHLGYELRHRSVSLAADLVELVAGQPSASREVRALGPEIRSIFDLADELEDVPAGISAPPALLDRFHEPIDEIFGFLSRFKPRVNDGPAPSAVPILLRAKARLAEADARLVNAIDGSSNVGSAQFALGEASGTLWDASLGAAMLNADPKVVGELATHSFVAGLDRSRSSWDDATYLKRMNEATSAGIDVVRRSLDGLLGQARLADAVAIEAPVPVGALGRVELLLRPRIDAGSVERIRDVVVGPELTKYGVDLTEQAMAGSLRGAVGRDDEMRRLLEVLGQDEKNNPLIVGPAGTGKTALLEELAIRMVAGEVPEGLKGRRFVSLDLGAMVAGTKHRGEFEKRLNKVVAELIAADGAIIPMVDEAHLLVSAGASGSSEGATQALKPLMGRGQLRLVSATTDKEVPILEEDGAFMRRLTKVEIEAPDAAGVQRILRLRAPAVMPAGVAVTDDALTAVRDLSDRYLLVDRNQPDAAIALLGEAAGMLGASKSEAPRSVLALRREVFDAAAELRVVSGEPGADAAARAGVLEVRLDELAVSLEALEVDVSHARMLARGEQVPEGVDADALRAAYPDLFATTFERRHVELAVSRMAGVPVGRVGLDESARLDGLAAGLKGEVLGQDGAMEEIASAIVRAKSGFKDPGLPVFSGVLFGPPGVGKTQTAKAVARQLFDDPAAIIRLDISTISRNGGDPIEAMATELRRRPGSVVLIDEVEKGTPEFFDALLTATGEGYITNRLGKSIKTSDAVFLLTSNLRTKDDVAGFFRPEFLDRMDATLQYTKPASSIIEELARREIGSVAAQVQASQGVELIVSDELVTKLAASVSSDPAIGVRDLKRAVKNELGSGPNTAAVRNAPKGSTIHLGVDANGHAGVIDATTERLASTIR